MVAISVTSLGYPGSIDVKSGAHYFSRLGASRYGVAERSDFAASVTTGDRMLRVTAGTAWAHNIVDEMSTTATVQLDAVTSGQRWDMIVLRRNPDTSTTTLEVIRGGADRALPARPSSTHLDQPLWLARAVAGQTTVQDLVDLRVWAGAGGATARDALVLGYLDQPGASIEISGTTWIRRVTANGTGSEWVPTGGLERFYPMNSTASWLNGGGVTVKQLPDGIRRVDVGVTIRRVGGDITYPAGGRAPGWTGLIPVEGRGSTMGINSDAVSGYAPLYRTTDETNLSFARYVYRIDPVSGNLNFRNGDGSTAFTWANLRQLSVTHTFFVR